MLAQNVKTAAELKITEREHAALREVLRRLEVGEIPDANFSMLNTMYHNDCQTIGCILGWARKADARAFTHTLATIGRTRPIALFDLFTHGGAVARCRSAEQGAAALRNYLTLGEAQWNDVLARR